MIAIVTSFYLILIHEYTEGQIHCFELVKGQQFLSTYMFICHSNC